jgi:hypothetical protein
VAAAARGLPESCQSGSSSQRAARGLPESCQSGSSSQRAARELPEWQQQPEDCQNEKKTGQKGRSKERGGAPLPYIYLLEIIVAAKTAVFARPQQEKTQFSKPSVLNKKPLHRVPKSDILKSAKKTTHHRKENTVQGANSFCTTMIP